MGLTIKTNGTQCDRLLASELVFNTPYDEFLIEPLVPTGYQVIRLSMLTIARYQPSNPNKLDIITMGANALNTNNLSKREYLPAKDKVTWEFQP